MENVIWYYIALTLTGSFAIGGMIAFFLITFLLVGLFVENDLKLVYR